MQVIIRSDGGRVPPRLRAIAARKLERIARLSREASRAEVHLTEERNRRISGRHACSVTVHLRHGSVVAHAAAASPELALDRVLDKLRHQVERRKDRRIKTIHAAGPRAPRPGRAPRGSRRGSPRGAPGPPD